MGVNPELLFNALLTGLLLGGFYAAVSVGITIAFGMLDIVNIAHPAFIILGAFVAFYLNSTFGIDPLLASLIATPPAFMVGGRNRCAASRSFSASCSSSRSVYCWYSAWTIASSRPPISERPSSSDTCRFRCVSWFR